MALLGGAVALLAALAPGRAGATCTVQDVGDGFSQLDCTSVTANVVVNSGGGGFLTQIIGQPLGGAAVFSQSFASAFGSPQVQAAVAAAIAQLQAAGLRAVGPILTQNSPVAWTLAAQNRVFNTILYEGPEALNVASAVCSFVAGNVLAAYPLALGLVASALPACTNSTTVVNATNRQFGEYQVNVLSFTFDQSGSGQVFQIFGVPYSFGAIFGGVVQSQLDSILQFLGGLTGQGGPDGGGPPAVAALGSQMGVAQLRRQFAQAGGMASDLLAQLPPAGPMAADAAVARRAWTPWARAVVNHAVNGRQGQLAGFHYTRGGVQAGVDYRAGEFVVGVAGGLLGAQLQLRGAEERARVTTFQLGTYAQYRSGPLRLAAAAGYGYDAVATERRVAGIPDTALANLSGHEYGARIEAGWRFAFAAVQVEPLAALAYAAYRQNGAIEQSGGIIGLNIRARTTEVLRTRLGARAALPFALAGMELVAEARAFWLHDFLDVRRVLDGSLAAGSPVFPLETAARGRDAALVGIGLGMQLGSALSAYVSYDAELRSRYTGHAVLIGGRLTW